jgi:hypothetical protein
MVAAALLLLVALAAGALPTPPKEVTYPAKLGEVQFRHDRHLERRESCRSCHGEGRVGKVALGKDAAHALCTGCHQKQGGPTACSSCHAIHGPGGKATSPDPE